MNRVCFARFDELGRLDVKERKVNYYPVLVVEDVDDIRNRYIVGLSRAAIEAHGAASLAEAQAKIARQTYSVAVIDINLQDARSDAGDRSGHEVLRRIKALGEGTKCLIVTAQQDMESGTESFRAGMDDILLKKEIHDDLGNFVEKVRDLQRAAKIVRLGSLGDLNAYLSKHDDRESWEHMLMSGLGLDANRLSQVIEIAFAPILPIRCLKNASYSLKKSDGGNGFFGIFWSRALGSAVEVEIGKDFPRSSSRKEDIVLSDKEKFGLRIILTKLDGLNVNEFEVSVSRQ
jgi:CheY-like chemotaxis protein